MRLKNRKHILWFFTSLCLLVICVNGYSDDKNLVPVPGNSRNTPSSGPVIVPKPPELNVGAYVLLDYNSGQVIAEKNMHKSMPPASLTKLMTAYIAENMLESGRINENDKVLISKKAWQTGGSTMFLEVGERVPVIDLLKGLIVVSGNDAAVALAEYIAGSEDAFVQLMNTTAKRMGLQNTHFRDANGLPDPQHYSSAYDIAQIARHIIQDHARYYHLYSIKEFQYGKNKQTGKPLNPQPNRLNLLWTNPAVDGLKTGHTKAAGYCLTASSKHGDRRLISVVLKSTSSRSRDVEAQKLLTYGLRFFDDVHVINKGVIKNVRLWQGQQDNLAIVAPEDIWVTVPKGSADTVQTHMKIDENIKAPIEKGTPVGTIQVQVGDNIVRQVKIVAAESIEEAGFFKRMWDSVVLFFHNMWASE